MIVNRSKPGLPSEEDIYNSPHKVDLVNTAGNTDYIKDGTIYQNSPLQVVLIESESDLDNLTDLYEPGTIAYTAGFAGMWQLDSEGNWVEVI